jgi:hypothetical protein
MKNNPRTVVIVLLAGLALLAIAFLAARCQPEPIQPTSPAQDPLSPSDTPEPTSAPATPTATAPPYPTLTPPALTPIPLPSQDAQAIEAIADAFGITYLGLATDLTILYALPDSGAVLLYTPPLEPPLSAPEEIQQIDQPLMIGGLTVVQAEVFPELPAQNYLVTITKDGQEIELLWLDEGGQGGLQAAPGVLAAAFPARRSALIPHGATAQFPMVVRSLAFPFPQPLTFITARQLCTNSGTAQVCLLVTLLPGSELQGKIDSALPQLSSAFGLDPAALSLELAVPDMEGQEAFVRCTKGITNHNPPKYSECLSNVLSIPMKAGASLPALPLPDPRFSSAESLGVLLVFTQQIENVYSDPFLQNPNLVDGQSVLPPGSYLLYGLIHPDDPLVGAPDGPQASYARVWLHGLSGESVVDYYIPSYYNVEVLGQYFSGNASLEGLEQSIILNLKAGKHCLFWQKKCKK